MHGHLGRRDALLVEHPGSAFVPALPHWRGQVLVDGRPHQGVHEPQFPLAFDQPLGHQRADRLGARVIVQPGEPGRPLGSGRGAEYRDSTGGGQGRRGHPPEPEQHVPRYLAGRQPPQVRQFGVGSAGSLGGQAGEQSPQQQRVPPGEFVAGVLKPR